MRRYITVRLIGLVVLAATSLPTMQAQEVIRSAASGPWSSPATWEGGKVPAAGTRVLVKPGHAVTYDLHSAAAIRAVQIGGTLAFARDRDTLLNVGLLRLVAGNEFSEE